MRPPDLRDLIGDEGGPDERLARVHELLVDAGLRLTLCLGLHTWAAGFSGHARAEDDLPSSLWPRRWQRSHSPSASSSAVVETASSP